MSYIWSIEFQLCVWSIDVWEKKKSRFIQAPAGRQSPLVGETKVQFHNDQAHLLVVHESQIAVYDSKLDCLLSVSFHLTVLVSYCLIKYLPSIFGKLTKFSINQKKIQMGRMGWGRIDPHQYLCLPSQKNYTCFAHLEILATLALSSSLTNLLSLELFLLVVLFQLIGSRTS